MKWVRLRCSNLYLTVTCLLVSVPMLHGCLFKRGSNNNLRCVNVACQFVSSYFGHKISSIRTYSGFSDVWKIYQNLELCFVMFYATQPWLSRRQHWPFVVLNIVLQFASIINYKAKLIPLLHDSCVVSMPNFL